MYIKDIYLKNFRNYVEEKVELEKGINIFYGDNAQGKTNVLEAIFISSLGKSFRTRRDLELINFEKENALLEINYEKTDREGNIKIEINDNKNIYLNKIKIKKMSELLGNVYTVLFTPDDINLFKESPSKRRKFLDILISQLRPAYLYNLNLYLKTLEQRNTYLKQIKFERKDENMLEIWDEKLVAHGEKVWKYRYEFIEKIKEKINVIHSNNTNNNENLKIEYITDFKNKKEFLEILKNSRRQDILKGYTSKRFTKRWFYGIYKW